MFVLWQLKKKEVVMKCLKCDNEMGFFEIKAWMVDGPAPRQAYKCAFCSIIWFEYTCFDGKSLLINISEKPQDIAMSKWIASKLLKKEA